MPQAKFYNAGPHELKARRRAEERACTTKEIYVVILQRTGIYAVGPLSAISPTDPRIVYRTTIRVRLPFLK